MQYEDEDECVTVFIMKVVDTKKCLFLIKMFCMKYDKTVKINNTLLCSYDVYLLQQDVLSEMRWNTISFGKKTQTSCY